MVPILERGSPRCSTYKADENLSDKDLAKFFSKKKVNATHATR